jgi:hypothetical protein
MEPLVEFWAKSKDGLISFMMAIVEWLRREQNIEGARQG